MSGPLCINVVNDTWTFTLDVPDKRNALSALMVEALLEGVTQAHASRARTLVFQGRGKNFSAGFDFSDIKNQSEGDLLLRFVRIEQLLQLVATSPCVTLAFAHGKNFGAGVDLIAVCRIRVVAPDVTFRMPGLKFGLLLGTRRFGDIVGKTVARRLLEGSETFGADTAFAIGFADEIAPLGQLEMPEASIKHAELLAASLDEDSRTALYAALTAEHSAIDLADLVRSAARPGLRQRIEAYLQQG
jgi:enoyl-CoA hydratase/carnithine racemase